MGDNGQGNGFARLAALMAGPALLLLLLLLGIKQYAIYSQAVEYRVLFLELPSCSVDHSRFFDEQSDTWEQAEPSRIFPRYLYWFPRYSVTAPAFGICEVFGVDAGFVFSLTVVLMCAATIVLTSFAFAGRESGPAFALAVSLFFFLVFLLMNGRVAFAFAGFSLVLLTIKQALSGTPTLRTVLAFAAGIYLSLVSSGTFFVSFLLIAWHLPAMFRAAKDVHVRLALVLFVAVCAYLLACAITFLSQFYGGLFQTMHGVFTHGALQYLSIGYVLPAAAVFILAVIATGFAIKVILSRKSALSSRHELYLPALAIPLIGAVFGLSAGSLVLVGIGALLAAMVQNLTNTQHLKRNLNRARNP